MSIRETTKQLAGSYAMTIEVASHNKGQKTAYIERNGHLCLGNSTPDTKTRRRVNDGDIIEIASVGGNQDGCSCDCCVEIDENDIAAEDREVFLESYVLDHFDALAIRRDRIRNSIEAAPNGYFLDEA